MNRIADLEAEVDRLKTHRAALDAEVERLSEWFVATGRGGNLLDAALQASDDTTDEIVAVVRELDELQDVATMRENARDRAWAQWRSL